MPKELTQKQSLFKEMMEDSMTKSEVIEIAKKLIAHIKKIDDRNKKDLSAMNSYITEASNNAKNDTSNSFDELKNKITSLVDKHVLDSSTAIGGKIEDLDLKMSEIRDGKDADEEVVAEKVRDMIEIPQIEEIKDDLPKMGDEIRDGLELLQGDERLDVSAIKGLGDRLNEFGGKLPKPQYVGGNPRPTFVDEEELNGTINGVNKVFTTNNIPSPATSLTIVIGTGTMVSGEDYTLSGQTVTFVTAPPTGVVIRVWYRM